jgi:hypothetical protein
MRQSGAAYRRGELMLGRVILVLWAILFQPMAALAAGEDCSALDGQEIEALLAEAPSCDQSMALFRICAYGASGDVGLGAIVREKCEGDFLHKLSRAERRRYDRWISFCERRYARESGTMYRSFEAFCVASVAQAFARNTAAKSLKSKRQR